MAEYQGEHPESEREKANRIIKKLASENISVEPYDLRDLSSLNYKIQFTFPEAKTMVLLLLNDQQSRLDVVIANMTTLPAGSQGQGYGRQAIERIIDWTRANDLHSIRATQVQNESVGFWQKLGFEPSVDGQSTNDYVYTV